MAATWTLGCSSLLGIEKAKCDAEFEGCDGFEAAETESESDATDTETDEESDAPPDASVETDTEPSVPTDDETSDATDDAPENPETDPGAPDVLDAGVDAGAKAQLCARYCSVVQSNCIGDDEQHGTVESCQEICAGLMVSEQELDGGTSSDTVECRLAAAQDAVDPLDLGHSA